MLKLDSDSGNTDTLDSAPVRSLGWKKTVLFLVLFLIVFSIVVWPVISPCLGVCYSWPLQRAASGLDRLVVEAVPEGRDADAPGIEIQGTEKVSEFFQTIELKTFQDGRRCACRGSLVFRFFRGEKESLTLSYHHGTRLDWHNGPWVGNAEMTEAGQQALGKWFADDGYEAVRDIGRREVETQKR